MVGEVSQRSEPRGLDASADVRELRGVGEVVAGHLRRAGIQTVGDLLRAFPRRCRPVAVIEAPDQRFLGQRVRLRAPVGSVRRSWLRGRRSLVTIELAGPEPVVLSFFNQPYLARSVNVGAERSAEGILDRSGGRAGRWTLTAPRLLPADPETGAVELIYPDIEGVTGGRFARLSAQAIERLDPDSMAWEPLPPGLHAWFETQEIPLEPMAALRAIHRPDTAAEHEAARRHFAVREAVALFRRVQAARDRREQRVGLALEIDAALDRRIAARIPFEWTADQARAVAALREQLGRGSPMGVLLQGDVGTGKTAVAVYCALAAVARGHQVAMLAPTELLAEQHHAGLARWLEGSEVRHARLTASLPADRRREVEGALADGGLDLVVGTHALMSQRASFARLGLCIVDEQQRFGVGQRMALVAKGHDPHVLVMTATPIPRTLALTAFGDLDLVSLRERPQGRPPARAIYVEPRCWRRVLSAIGRRVSRGQRVYVVCPKVGEGGEKGGAVRLHRELRAHFAVGLVHGRLSSAERQQVVGAFQRGEVDVLVGTTVLEVGVDVPEATLMVVVGCDRFGLSTLHQLRGRVGRGRTRGLCILTGAATARTAALCRTTDGFELAEEDLALRGGGELLGKRQSGHGSLSALSFAGRDAADGDDRDLLLVVRQAVREESVSSRGG